MARGRSRQSRRHGFTATVTIGFVLLLGRLLSVPVSAAQDPVTPPTSLENALPPDATGEQIFRQSCSTCHSIDGTGSPQAVLGFQIPLPNGHTLPDFNDCPTNTVEPLG